MLSKRMVWVVAALFATVAACAPGNDEDSWSAEALGRRAQDQLLSARVANTSGTLAVGENRLTIAFSDESGGLIHDIENATLRIFALDDQGGGTLVVETPLRPSQLFDEDHDQSSLLPAVSSLRFVADSRRAPVRPPPPPHEEALVTLYTANLSFDRLGFWGAELSVERDGERQDGLRVRFFVSDRSEIPMIGDIVPRTEQKVLRDVSDISEISTATNPNPAMYRQTIAEALDSGVPVVIGVTTPLFCETRFCGPVLEQALRPLLGRYVHDVVVLHIEPFELEQIRAGNRVPVPMMTEWGLESEPWVFVVGADGRLAARFEGVVTEEELVEVIDALLAE